MLLANMLELYLDIIRYFRNDYPIVVSTFYNTITKNLQPTKKTPTILYLVQKPLDNRPLCVGNCHLAFRQLLCGHNLDLGTSYV